MESEIYFGDVDATPKNLALLERLVTHKSTITKMEVGWEDGDVDVEFWTSNDEHIILHSCTHLVVKCLKNNVDFFWLVYDELYKMWKP